jgi:riboflavin kinase/FMN adenylyltransferase
VRPDRDAIVVIGNFDGVHRGHQAVLDAVCAIARARALSPRMLTFEPHPAVTLGRTPPALLTTLERKIELVERQCSEIQVVVRGFTPAFASQSPEEFVERVLVGELDAKAVMVGLNFRFGRGRSGGIDDLERLGAAWGFDTLAEPLVSDGRGAWSSTRVREQIAAGDLDGAASILGRPHMISGVVARGDQRGRTIGFATCNLPDVPEALPPLGVYAVLVDQVTPEGARGIAKGVANLGLRPTVEAAASKPLFEVHLLDWQGELYDARLRVHLVARLREERRFSGLDGLKAQIAADTEAARERLADWEIDPLRAWA